MPAKEDSGKAFLFDIDDTIGETTEFVSAALPQVVKAMRAAGLPVREEHLPIAADMLEEIRRANKDSQGHDLDLLCKLYHVTDAERKQIVDAGVRKFRQIRDVYFEAKPYARQVFEYLLSNNYRLGIVSNGDPKVQWGKIEKIGFEMYFKDCFFASDDPKVMKPNPHMIFAALVGLGADPASSYYVGDRDTDVIAAKHAGVTAVRYFAGHHRGTSAVSRMLHEGVPPDEIVSGRHDNNIRQFSPDLSIYGLEDIMRLDLR